MSHNYENVGFKLPFRDNDAIYKGPLKVKIIPSDLKRVKGGAYHAVIDVPNSQTHTARYYQIELENRDKNRRGDAYIYINGTPRTSGKKHLIGVYRLRPNERLRIERPSGIRKKLVFPQEQYHDTQSDFNPHNGIVYVEFILEKLPDTSKYYRKQTDQYSLEDSEAKQDVYARKSLSLNSSFSRPDDISGYSSQEFFEAMPIIRDPEEHYVVIVRIVINPIGFNTKGMISRFHNWLTGEDNETPYPQLFPSDVGMDITKHCYQYLHSNQKHTDRVIDSPPILSKYPININTDTNQAKREKNNTNKIFKSSISSMSASLPVKTD